MAARPGFEPRPTEPESVVLPLHHRATHKKFEKYKVWLPDQDSNLDKLNQNQLCYRYTIGQAVTYYSLILKKSKWGN